MKLLSKIFSALLGLVLLGALVAAAFFGFNYLASIFAKLDQQVAIVTTIATATMLLSAAMIASGLRWAKAREHDQQSRAHKAALYERFLKIWSEAQRASAGEIKFSEDPTTLEKPLLLWAGPEVLKAYLAVREQAKSYGPQSGELSSQRLDLILAMRHDLGQSIQGMDKAALLDLLHPSVENALADSAPAVNNNHRQIRFPA